MKINLLSPGPSYDVPDVLIHMTGRTSRPHPDLPQDISQMSALERLQAILATRSFRAGPAFDNAWPVVCFSQMTQRGMSSFVGSRYVPAGLALYKQAVFEAEGGPAYYVRGDEYDVLRTELPGKIGARAVRLWPGSTPETVDDFFKVTMHNRSEWMHEREWRIPAPTSDPWTWSFPEPAVCFIILESSQLTMFRTWALLRQDPWIANLPVATWDARTNFFDATNTPWR